MTADREPSAVANDAAEAHRQVYDPFLKQTVHISNRLTDRLRGKYAVGPTLPNGEPEFGWRQHDTPPIQHEAANEIDNLASRVSALTAERDNIAEACLERTLRAERAEILANTAEANSAKAREAAIEECTKKIEAVSQTCVHDSWSCDISTNVWAPPEIIEVGP